MGTIRLPVATGGAHAIAPLLAIQLHIPPDSLRRAGAIALAIDLLALASLWRSRKHSTKAKLVWTAIIALLPVLGATAWVVLGRERRAHRRSLD
jgi:hypothetical protein